MQTPTVSKYTKRDVSIDLLRSLVAYDAESGQFLWLERAGHLFQIPAAAAAWNARHAGKPAFTNADRNGYLRAGIFGAHFFAHRVAYAVHHGCWPKLIDHINGDTGDNRIVNLRDADYSENRRNARLDHRNKSGHIGVFRRKTGWSARIGIGPKVISLGTFSTKAEAIEARKTAEREHGFHANHGRAA